MGVLFWVVAAGAAAGGYYCCRRLKEMEAEIRGEVGDEESPAEDESRAAAQPARAAEKSPARRDGETDPGSVEARIVAAVEDLPGRLQTELYEEFPETGRRRLQEILRSLEEEGRLRREKEGSSYRLFPVGPTD